MCVSARRQLSLEDRTAPVRSEPLGQTQNCDGGIQVPKREFLGSGRDLLVTLLGLLHAAASHIAVRTRCH